MFLGHVVFIETYQADNRVHTAKPLSNMYIYIYVYVYEG